MYINDKKISTVPYYIFPSKNNTQKYFPRKINTLFEIPSSQTIKLPNLEKNENKIISDLKKNNCLLKNLLRNCRQPSYKKIQMCSANTRSCALQRYRTLVLRKEKNLRTIANKNITNVNINGRIKMIEKYRILNEDHQRYRACILKFFKINKDKYMSDVRNINPYIFMNKEVSNFELLVNIIFLHKNKVRSGGRNGSGFHRNGLLFIKTDFLVFIFVH